MKINFFSKKIKNCYPFVWAIASVLVLLWGWIQFDGYYGYDDIAYAHWAWRIINGEFFFTNDHFSYRIGITFPVAFLFSIFGVDDFGAIAFPALGLVVCLYAVSKAYDTEKEKFWSVFLLSTSYYTIWYSFKLYPDVWVALCHFLVVYAVVLQNTKKVRDQTAALILSFSLFYGFMCKETIVFVVPFLIYKFFEDYFKNQNKIFWYHMFLFCVVFAIAFLLFSYIITGSALHRFQVIISNRYYNACSYDQMDFSVTLKRISIGLISSLFAWQIAHPILFALMYRPLNSIHAIWIKALLIDFLSFNFLTTSHNSYLPMCLEGRHFLALAPIGAVAAAPSAVRFFTNGTFKTAFITAIVIAVFLFWVSDYKLIVLYVFWIAGVIMTGLKMKKIGLALVILSLLAHPLYVLTKKSETHYLDMKRILRNYTKNTDSDLVFISDQTAARIGSFILKFNPKYQWMEYDSIESKNNIPEMIWLYNPYTEEYLKKYAPHLSGREMLSGYSKILIAKKRKIELWKLIKH